MAHNRVANLLTTQRPQRFSWEFATTSEQPAPTAAFVTCPMSLISTSNAAQLQWQTHVYRAAFEQAQAVVEARRQVKAMAYLWN